MNPFRKFGSQIDRDDSGRRGRKYNHKKSGPSWKWKGDISFGLGTYSGSMSVEEIVIQVARLKLSDSFEIKFDLFLFDDAEYRRTGFID